VGAFSLVELESAREGFEDGVGNSPQVSPFEAGVVLRAHAGEHGHFLALESGHPSGPAVGGQSGLGWCDARPPAREELRYGGPFIRDRNWQYTSQQALPRGRQDWFP
jgi:hypothetical protein